MIPSAFVDDTPTIQLWAAPEQPLASAPGAQVELAPGCILRGRYVLEEVIGRGGTSVIFRAKDLHRTLPQDMAPNFVALKLLHPALRTDPLALVRLKREFRQMQCLAHPGIVRVFDLDCDGEVWFLSMEFVAGRTVKSWMATTGGYEHALNIIGACCEALEHAHSLGVLHGDLKPTNVLVADDGTVKLIDFGSTSGPGSVAATGSDPTLTATPLYASPQILARQRAERRDDIFSLACLSYSLLSGGRHPFGERPSLEDGRAKSAPNQLPAIPAELFEVIERGLSAERQRRPVSVREFLRELTDAEQRRCAARTNAAVRSFDHVGAVAHPTSALSAATNASGAPSGALVRYIPRAAGGVTSVTATGIAPAALASIGHEFGHGRHRFRRAQPVLKSLAVVLAVVGAAVLFRLDSRRDVSPAAELPLRTSATSPGPAARTRTAVRPTAPLPPGGIIASVPPTPVADAQPSLVAISAKRLQTAVPLPNDNGVISFDAPTLQASAKQPLVAISVRRVQATSRPGAFMWRVESGTAHPGVDYERMEPQLVRFAEGQAVRTLFIPLINAPATSASRGPRNFTVLLQQVADGPALGRVARVTVAIDPPPTVSAFAAP